jgi:hypothetical protein
MKQVTLHIPDEKYSFFMELRTRLGFVKKNESKKKEKIAETQALTGFREAVHQMNLVKQGKLKARDARELLNEL